MLEYDNIYNKNIPKMVKTRLTIQICLKHEPLHSEPPHSVSLHPGVKQVPANLLDFLPAGQIPCTFTVVPRIQISDQYSYKKYPSKIKHYVRKNNTQFSWRGNYPLCPPLSTALNANSLSNLKCAQRVQFPNQIKKVFLRFPA